MAKIECRTYPQMATVRVTKDAQGEIIVAGGKGAKQDFQALMGFAIILGAYFGVSWVLTDMGLVPYEMQIGLTGKMASPRVYIAAGISGAVHHTCAIERAGTVIAINHDINARIFDYADFGVVGKIKEVLEKL